MESRSSGKNYFPGQPAPSKEHWANFRKCLRLTFCKTTSPYQRKGSYKLDTRLGGWFERERQVHYPCNVTPQGIFWRENGQYYKCEKSSTTNFYTIVNDVTCELPGKSHPVAYRRTSETGLWNWRKYRTHTLPTIQENVQVNEDNYHEKEHERLDLVSDAAVHEKARKVARAWQLFNERSNKRRVALPLEHQIHSHSFQPPNAHPWRAYDSKLDLESRTNQAAMNNIAWRPRIPTQQRMTVSHFKYYKPQKKEKKKKRTKILHGATHQIHV